MVHISNWHTNWILAAIFRESAQANGIRPAWRVYQTGRKDLINPKVVKGKITNLIGALNVYAHQETYFSIFKKNPSQITSNRNRVYFTHFNEGQSLSQENIHSLMHCEKILVQNDGMKLYLESVGVEKQKIVKIPGAVDRTVYFPGLEPPDREYVLFSGDFKYRKNPELVAQIIQRMPDIDFIIHGKNWQIFPNGFFESMPNVLRLDFDISRQAKLMRSASAFVTLSYIEGGPYSVLEALASGTPVVATDTGFCREFINSSNGILLPNIPDKNEVESSIRTVLKLKKLLWGRDLLNGKWQWRDLGRLIYD